jgi:hypothetical protein
MQRTYEPLPHPSEDKSSGFIEYEGDDWSGRTRRVLVLGDSLVLGVGCDQVPKLAESLNSSISKHTRSRLGPWLWFGRHVCGIWSPIFLLALHPCLLASNFPAPRCKSVYYCPHTHACTLITTLNHVSYHSISAYIHPSACPLQPSRRASLHHPPLENTHPATRPPAYQHRLASLWSRRRGLSKHPQMYSRRGAAW